MGSLPGTLALPKFSIVVVPEPNVHEAAVVNEIDVHQVASLSAAKRFMAGASELPTQHVDGDTTFPGPVARGPVFAYVKGQSLAKRRF